MAKRNTKVPPPTPHPRMVGFPPEFADLFKPENLVAAFAADGSITPAPGRTMFDVFAGAMLSGQGSERQRQRRSKVIGPAIAENEKRATPRRAEMARRLRRGQTIKEIAADMRASRNTVAAVKRTLR